MEESREESLRSVVDEQRERAEALMDLVDDLRDQINNHQLQKQKDDEEMQTLRANLEGENERVSLLTVQVKDLQLQQGM